MAWRSLRSRLAATVASFIAILLGSALGAAALIVGQSADHAAVQGALSSWHFRQVDLAVKLSTEVETSSGLALSLTERPRFSGDQLRQITRTPGVREVVTETPFPAYALTSSGIIGNAQHRSWGHSWNTALAEPFTLISGHAPNSARDVVLSDAVAKAANKRITDSITIMTAQGNREFIVSGIGNWPGTEYEHALFFTPAIATELGGQPSLALLRLTPEANSASVTNAINDAIPGAVVLSGENKSRALVVNRSQAELSSGAGTFLGTIAACALAIAVFVISSTLSVSVMQRRRELALLRSVGARVRHIRALVLGEAAFIGIFAGVFGGLVGIVLAQLAIQLFAEQGLMPRQVTLVIGWLPFVVGAGVAVLAAVIAAAAPAWRASRIAPSEALRVAEVSPNTAKQSRTWWGVISLIIAGLFISSGVISGLAGGTMALQIAPVMMMMAAPFLMLAAILLGRYILRGILLLLHPLLKRSVGGFLSERELRADMGRAVGVSTPLAIMVGFSCLMLFQDVTTFEARARSYDSRLTADVVISGTEQLGLPDTITSSIAQIPGVKAISSTISTSILPVDKVKPGSIVDAIGVDPTAVSAVFDLPAIDGRWTDFTSDSIAVSQAVAQDYNWKAGNEVSFLLADGTATKARVAVIYQSGTATFAATMLPKSLVQKHLLEPLISGAYLRLDPQANRAAIDTALVKLQQEYPTLRVLNRAEHLSEVGRQSSGDNWIMYLVVILIAGYAGIAAINVLVGSAMARRRRFALLRLAGAQPLSVLSSVIWEVAITVLSGILIGSAVAAIVLLGYGYVFTGELWLAFSPIDYLMICASAIVVGIVGGVLPVRLALRTKALDAMYSA